MSALAPTALACGSSVLVNRDPLAARFGYRRVNVRGEHSFQVGTGQVDFQPKRIIPRVLDAKD
jgi:hypothetical protein